jgi:hypothetical protein
VLLSVSSLSHILCKFYNSILAGTDEIRTVRNTYLQMCNSIECTKRVHLRISRLFIFHFLAQLLANAAISPGLVQRCLCHCYTLCFVPSRDVLSHDANNESRALASSYSSITMKPNTRFGVQKSRSCISNRCLFFSGLAVISLLFTALFTRMQPSLQAASKIQVVDRSSKVLRPSVSTNEFHLGPVAGGDKKVDDDKFDAVVLAPTNMDATTRDISVPKSAVKNIRANTGRSSLPDSVKPFQVDAFEALRMYESGTTLPTTDKTRKESKEIEPIRKKKEEKERSRDKKEKKEKRERPQRNKKAATSNRANTREGGLPQVAWIMSFGGSVSDMLQVDEWATWLQQSIIDHTLPGI